MPTKSHDRRKSSGRTPGEPAQTEAEPKKAGRPSPYAGREIDIVTAIVARLKKGEPMAVICRDEGMPDPDTVAIWREKDKEIDRLITRARSDGFDAIAAECLTIADDGSNDTYMDDDGNRRVDSDVIQRSKLRVETRLKLLAKWDPKRYGEKVEVTGDGAKTEITVNLTLPESRRTSLLERRRQAMEAGRN